MELEADRVAGKEDSGEKGREAMIQLKEKRRRRWEESNPDGDYFKHLRDIHEEGIQRTIKMNANIKHGQSGTHFIGGESPCKVCKSHRYNCECSQCQDKWKGRVV